MSIAETIAKYRKAKGLTQEQLGELLGVTNQAVSKWESGVSMPDVMLLPKITEALGITFQQLYDIPVIEEKVKADDFPAEANKKFIEYFKEQSGIDFHTPLEDPWALVCVSDICGAAYCSNSLSFIETDYKAPGSEQIFGSDKIASAMKKLSDSKVRNVLTYMYQTSFAEKHTWCRHFSVSDICKACTFETSEALEIIEKLNALNLLEIIVNEEEREYIFLKSRAPYVLLVFKGLDLLLQETYAYEVLRDTSVINDNAFETLWKK